jgi:hypothetical protein
VVESLAVTTQAGQISARAVCAIAAWKKQVSAREDFVNLLAIVVS